VCHCDGVIVNELRWNETFETQAGRKRELPIPGRDLSGVVVEVGPGVTAGSMSLFCTALGEQPYTRNSFYFNGIARMGRNVGRCNEETQAETTSMK
jgi:NADPH:quinone reductase-like Zn-dependent oxidoreductase